MTKKLISPRLCIYKLTNEFLIKILSILGFIFLSSTIYGSTKAYELKMELSLAGEKVGSASMIVEAGKSGMITQETNNKKSFIAVVANEDQIQNTKGILMKFIVGTIDSNGKKEIISRPEIIALENEKAKITIQEKDGKEALSLSVMAKRKNI